ncbi:MAG: molybdopterin-dependent oxidoreductase [Methanopyri archaeon]|jgi:DMSO/TMAO reductase YedYZ molybdopterin-dependent catalytic subunit|nr:molybdopterin-dependent oxidoreductase [Methanopyri archaeon]
MNDPNALSTLLVIACLILVAGCTSEEKFEGDYPKIATVNTTSKVSPTPVPGAGANRTTDELTTPLEGCGKGNTTRPEGCMVVPGNGTTEAPTSGMTANATARPEELAPDQDDLAAHGPFPNFITSNEDYFVTRIGGIPEINPSTYRLAITGLVQNPREYTLEELRALKLVELPLTVECIGKSPSGPAIGTAVWMGFSLYDLLESLGLDESATGVKYRAADGYYASHTMEQVRENRIIGALYMNDQVIPPLHGFPLRFLNPGYYGVKQPMWVTDIEVIDGPIKDYWGDRGWDVSPPMAIDSTIFFPDDGVQVKVGDVLEMGGAAFGGTRVARVQITADRGRIWHDTEIVGRMDVDNVWAFWKAGIIFPAPGDYTVHVRATDINGNTQIEDDPVKYDGNSDWPMLEVQVTE